MEHSSSRLHPRDMAKVSLSLVLPARPTISNSEPVDPPEAPADRTFSPSVVRTPAAILPPRPNAHPFVALADLWERQATSLEDLSASVGGAPGLNQAAALLRENAAELRAALELEGGH